MANKVERAAQRSLERALKEERLGLAAIAKVFVLESPEPGRLLARLDAMARAAEANTGTPLKVRRALLDGARLVRTAIEREMRKPQSLLDPPGHVTPAAVNKLVGTDSASQQLGLTTEGGLEDAAGAHEERVRTLTAIHEGIVTALRYGPATDGEILKRYTALRGAPYQSPGALVERRKELSTAGRICSSGSRHRGQAMWELVEQEELLQESRRNP